MFRETVFLVIIALSAITTTSSATRVTECKSGKAFANQTQVSISGCDAPPCVLKRKTKIDIQQYFTPDRDVHSLISDVNAVILGIPLPFVGVSGTNACNLVHEVDGTKAGCPLKKGKEYIYKNSFPVHNVYPKVSLVVNWALKEGNRDIACFKVPAKIV